MDCAEMERLLPNLSVPKLNVNCPPGTRRRRRKKVALKLQSWRQTSDRMTTSKESFLTEDGIASAAIFLPVGKEHKIPFSARFVSARAPAWIRIILCFRSGRRQDLSRVKSQKLAVAQLSWHGDGRRSTYKGSSSGCWRRPIFFSLTPSLLRYSSKGLPRSMFLFRDASDKHRMDAPGEREAETFRQCCQVASEHNDRIQCENQKNY